MNKDKLSTSIAAAFVVSSLILTGCAAPKTRVAAPVENRPAVPGTSSAPTTSSVAPTAPTIGGPADSNGVASVDLTSGNPGESASTTPDAGPTDEADLGKRTIFFDYDQDLVREDQQQLVMAHARYLAKNTRAKVRLEGHADERGTPAYNLALGERRAMAVADMMRLQGVQSQQIEVISYGKERPVIDGHGETFWAQNRRVEIVYTAK